MRGTIRMSDPEQRRILAVHQRFYTALALNDLVNEMSLKQVANKYGATKGMLQGLQQAAATFSGDICVMKNTILNVILKVWSLCSVIV